MASLVPDAVVAEMTGFLENHFDTFFVPIIIYRPGKVTTTVINQGGQMFGYGPSNQSRTNTAIVPDTGALFFALETTPDELDQTMLSPLKLTEEVGEIRIEVKEAARDYLLSHEVEKIVVFPQGEEKRVMKVENGKTYNLDSQDAPKNFLGLTYYVFKLKATL